MDEARPPATFRGILALDAFAYTPPASGPPRRDPPRAATTEQTQASSSPSNSPTSSARAPTASPSPPASSPRRRPSAKTPSSTSSPAARKNQKRAPRRPRYAPPSQYAHLPPLPDALGPDLLTLFIGLNPGVATALAGHAYAHPSNLFWKLLHSSGITPTRCRPAQDKQLPARYALGLTNIVSRPSRSGAELRGAELDEGVAVLEAKARRWRPESVCVVGKGIWESIWRVRHGGAPVGRAFRYGWQAEAENMGVVEGEWPGASVFVASSTSGLAAGLRPEEKEAIWAELGAWVRRRRAEREREAGGCAA